MPERDPRGYIRVELQQLARDGRPKVTYDKVFFVAPDGTETEISDGVAKILIYDGVGEARRIELSLYGVDIQMQP